MGSGSCERARAASTRELPHRVSQWPRKPTFAGETRLARGRDAPRRVLLKTEIIAPAAAAVNRAQDGERQTVARRNSSPAPTCSRHRERTPWSGVRPARRTQPRTHSRVRSAGGGRLRTCDSRWTVAPRFPRVRRAGNGRPRPPRKLTSGERASSADPLSRGRPRWPRPRLRRLWPAPRPSPLPPKTSPPRVQVEGSAT